MKERLEQFLSLEQLTPARFADILGIQRSGISHILSGRNKPSYDFIEKVMSKYPLLNIDWLITGKGKVYKELSPVKESVKGDLFTQSNNLNESHKIITQQVTAENITRVESKSEPLPVKVSPEKRVKKIILIYEDRSFEELISTD